MYDLITFVNPSRRQIPNFSTMNKISVVFKLDFRDSVFPCSFEVPLRILPVDCMQNNIKRYQLPILYLYIY